MAAYYGVIFPEFWTGHTGRQLRQQGGKDAQLLALYLATCRHANMLGLYRVYVDDIAHETGLTIEAIADAFDTLDACDFAVFDATSSYVWVKHMVRFRLHLVPDEILEPTDKRTAGARRVYAALDPNPFLAPFFDAYAPALRLPNHKGAAKVSEPRSLKNTLPSPPSGPLRHPFGTPWKPVTGSVSVSGSVSEIRGDVRTSTVRSRARTRGAAPR